MQPLRLPVLTDALPRTCRKTGCFPGTDSLAAPYLPVSAPRGKLHWAQAARPVDSKRDMHGLEPIRRPHRVQDLRRVDPCSTAPTSSGRFLS